MSTLTKKIYIAGTVSGSGKSSLCAALLQQLLHHHSANQLAYIKPVTQCLAPQPVASFCEQQQIEHQAIGPVVLSPVLLQKCYQGDPELPSSLLAEAKAAVNNISQNKACCMVDGTGYPGVGSIAGVSNGQVAQAVEASVILVCNKVKTGDAIDTIDWMRRYFEYFSVKIDGIIFNQLSAQYYQQDADKLKNYYANYHSKLTVLGCIPQLESVTAENLGGYIHFTLS